MLKIEHLTKSYAKSAVKAVDNLSLELQPREIFGFLGPNGAGKTTTIKALTGILSFESGRIEICGEDIVKSPIAAKRNFGYVSDSHILYDKLTGREYIDFMADIYGVDLETRKARAETLLDRFSLREAFDQQIKSYSHGMKQKINIIGALIHNPNLWVLFFSTHVLEVAEKLCDRVGIIVKGRLLTVGTLDEIKEQSKDNSLEEAFLSVTSGDEHAAV